jgi:rfaE bifunctional protein kinase chain/domain/rfaE bifunctional protein nucleotidyltransferase chain/domain
VSRPRLAKVKPREELRALIDAAKQRGERVVQCHGCFDILHPGHLRHLAWAREQGDLLVVSVSADSVVQKGPNRPCVPERLRAESLAALEVVDWVTIDDGDWAGPILEFFKPDIYVKGKEFEDVHDGRFGRERRLVTSFGGRVVFSSGDVVYSSTKIIDAHREHLEPVGEQVRAYCLRHGITTARIRALAERFRSCKLLVIGETIVDTYVYAQPLGMSAEAPVLVVRPTESESFVGGAAVVAQHIAAQGAESLLISVVGRDAQAELVERTLIEKGVRAELVRDGNRPTTHKTRYLCEGKKLLGVNVFRDHDLEPEALAPLLDRIDAASDSVDAIVIADFGYGVVARAVLERVADIRRRRGIPVVGDVQSSTQLGNVARLEQITIATPSEREARLALCDRESGIADLGARLLRETRNEAMAVTLGGRGVIVLDTAGKSWDTLAACGHLHELKRELLIEYLPSLARFPVDPMGAGDAFLGTLAVSLAAGGGVMLAAYLGTCAAAFEVGCMGNIPVPHSELLRIAEAHAEEDPS